MATSFINGLYITPYKSYSKSAKALSKALRARRLTFNDVNSFAKYSDGEMSSIGYSRPKIVINWGFRGAKTLPSSIKLLNQPKSVELASNKINFFKAAEKEGGPRVPEFTTDSTVAMGWVEAGEDVLGRQKTGSCGLDIVTFSDDPIKFAGSDFWVKYKKKKAEFRIHIINGEIVDRQQKLLRTSDEFGQPIDRSTVNFRVRNHRNGFIFARNDIGVPEDVDTQALAAMKATGLDFGAVDVIFNAYEGKAYVLEVNTAPGLEGTTLTTYVEKLGALIA